MEILFKEKKQLPQVVIESICNSLLKTLSRFKDKIREVSVNVKDFNFEKPFMIKNLQVFITMKNGEKYYIQKSDSSLLTATQNMVKAVKGLMSNKALVEKRKRVPIYLYNQE